MFVHLTNASGNTIYSTVPDKFRTLRDACNVSSDTFVLNGAKYRHGRASDDNGEVYFLTGDMEIVNRPRVFREKMRVYLEFIPQIKNIEANERAKVETHGRRLLHNLTALNGHNIQEVFTIISEQELRSKVANRKEYIKQQVKSQIDKIPGILMNIMKNNAAIKMEFSVAAKLNSSRSKIEKQRHEIRKALMNVFHLFFQDFTDKGIYVDVEECDVAIMLDYESFQVAIYQLLDNAAKYAKNQSDIKVSFLNSDNTFSIIIDMFSLKIEDDELSKITQEGFCGKQAIRIKKNGKGIGMYVVKQALALNNAKISIIPLDHEVKITGVVYSKNRFEIKFPGNLMVH